MQIRCNFPDISYLSETQKSNFQFLNKGMETRTLFNTAINGLIKRVLVIIIIMVIMMMKMMVNEHTKHNKRPKGLFSNAVFPPVDNTLLLELHLVVHHIV